MAVYLAQGCAPLSTGWLWMTGVCLPFLNACGALVGVLCVLSCDCSCSDNTKSRCGALVRSNRISSALFASPPWWLWLLLPSRCSISLGQSVVVLFRCSETGTVKTERFSGIVGSIPTTADVSASRNVAPAWQVPPFAAELTGFFVLDAAISVPNGASFHFLSDAIGVKICGGGVRRLTAISDSVALGRLV